MGGALPCQLGVWGLSPRKKNQFFAKNYAILSKFWYFFPILQQKVGGLSPSPESGGPIPLSPPPCSDAYDCCSTVYCDRPCLCVFVCGSVTTIPRNCVGRSLPNSVGKGSDHLQLIKFWPSRAPGKGYAAGRIFLAPPLYSQCAVSASV